MEKPDISSLASKMIEATRAYVTRETAPLIAQISELKAQLAALPAPVNGKDADPELIRAEVIKAVALIPAAKDGKDADPEMVAKLVRDAAAALPKPADGKGVTVEDVAPIIAGAVELAVAAIPKPKDGKDADPAVIREIVADAVADLPKAKDGTSVTVDDVRPLIADAVVKAVSEIPKPKDGASIHPDTVALMVRETVEKAVASLPAAKDGEPGRDATQLTPLPSIDQSRSYPAGTYAKHNGGEIRAERRTDPVKDGDLLAAGWTVAREGVAALVITQGDDPRAIEVAAMLTSGTKILSTFFMPTLIYRDIWREGEYSRGDVVTWGGSAWHCQNKTTEKPGTGCADWKLMVKEGQRGKDYQPPAASVPQPVRTR